MTRTNKMKLDVTVTASVRPAILRMTLHTFKKNLLGNFDVRVIINVDPRGEIETHTQKDMVEVCYEYFDNVIHRTPDTSSFAGAVRWCWSQVQTEFFFHLEDDWILSRKIPAAELLKLFADRQVVGVALTFRTKRSAIRSLRRKDETVRFYDGDYLRVPTTSLCPSLHRAATLKPLAEKLTPDRDPEFQLEEMSRTSDGVFLWRVKSRPNTINSGITWRKLRGVEKSFSGDGQTYAPSKPISLARKVELTVRWYVSKWWWRVVYCQ